MKTDGKFTITGGGITQGIQKELGLTDQECHKLNSVWSSIINEFEGQTDGQANMTVTNNKGEAVNKGNNYKIHKDAVVEFSKSCWQRIVNLVNKTLNKNIEIENSETVQTDKTTKTNNNTESENIIASNKQNLKNAYDELSSKSMSELLVQKYKLNENQFKTALDKAYQGNLSSLPKTECNTADFAMSMLFSVFTELMPENKKEAVKNAVIEVSQHYKDIEGANIGGALCKDIISDRNKIDEVTAWYLQPSQEEKQQYVQIAKNAIADLIDNFDNMEFPQGVNKENVLNKIKNYNPEHILELSGHYRFGLKIEEKPSKADIATAIISDVLGMNLDDAGKKTREIKSEISLRQTAVNNVMKMYENESDMTLKGTKLSEIKNRAEQHQKAIDKAVQYIKDNFTASGLGKQVDETLFERCLDSITLDIESSGAGRSEDGVLAIETNDNDIKFKPDGTLDDLTLSKTVKLLIHETYHLYLYKAGKHPEKSSKEEEACAEMLALRVMANLCNNNPPLQSFDIYGQPISSYTSNESVANNERFNTEFLGSSGYTQHTGTVEEAIQAAKRNIKV